VEEGIELDDKVDVDKATDELLKTEDKADSD